LSLFFFNDTATTEIYTLSLHDALPISSRRRHTRLSCDWSSHDNLVCRLLLRSEEHTSELQSHDNIVCRLLLEKKKPRRESRSQPVHDRPGRLRPPQARGAHGRGGSRGGPGAHGPTCRSRPSSCFFFNDTATTEIYNPSLHDGLPI